MKSLTCDVVIVGASMGGVAAAIASAGHDVILVAAHDWIGGQMTAQGVSALDEHKYIEQFGGTRLYDVMCQRIRDHYMEERSAPELMPDGTPLNPGNGWVSRLCFEPHVGLKVLRDMMPETVTIVMGFEVTSADVDNRTIRSIHLQNAEGEQLRIVSRYYLDATDTGDLLPLTGTAYVTGAESHNDTGEPNAPEDARPTEVQSFTYCFAIEHHPGEDHTIDKPENYESMRDDQPYSLILHDKQGNPRYFHMFKNDEEQGNLPFWTYRRINDGDTLDGIDLALINWHGNDYYGGNILDVPDADKSRFLLEAQQLAIGFLYWLQTECPRDDGGRGYPGFKLRTDVMGTDSGLSREPYIRESRRIQGLRRIIEQDISADYNPDARAKNMYDSVGVGRYAIDLHPCVGNKTVSMFAPTKPFQIPLHAMIPEKTTNLIPACKNIATTHLTNGAYRLHPIEWNIGESAMRLALYCLQNSVTLHEVATDPDKIRRLQYQLVKHGIPIAWSIDVSHNHSLFLPTQLLLVIDGILDGDTERIKQLHIAPDHTLDAVVVESVRSWVKTISSDDISVTQNSTWSQLCEQVSPILDEYLR